MDCYIFYIKNTHFSCFLMYITQYVSMQFLLFFFWNCSSSSFFFFFDKRPLKQDQGRRIKSEASRETFLQIHHIGSRVESFLYFYFSSKWLKWNTHDSTGNHTCFILVILNCISLYSHVYQALSNSICYNFHNYISISKFSGRVPRSFEFHDRVNARRTKYLGDRISTGYDCSDSSEVLFTLLVLNFAGT